MAGLDDFAKRMTTISVQVEDGVERVMRDCAQAVTRSVISNTPADTGSGSLKLDRLAGRGVPRPFPARIPGVAGSTGDANAVAAIEAASDVIESFDIEKNRSIHITNNLDYIGSLNDGHSKQAPADFVHMAVMDGLATVRGVKVLEV